MQHTEYVLNAMQQGQGPAPSPLRPSGLSRPSPPQPPHAAHAQVSLGVGTAVQQPQEQQQPPQQQQPRPGRPRAPVINPFAAAQQRMQVRVAHCGIELVINMPLHVMHTSSMAVRPRRAAGYQ